MIYNLRTVNQSLSFIQKNPAKHPVEPKALHTITAIQFRPAILLASIELAPSSCLRVMLARRKEWGPRPSKSQPSVAAARFNAWRTPRAICRTMFSISTMASSTRMPITG